MTKNILILITLLITQSNLIYSSEPQTKSDADSKRSSPASQITSPCSIDHASAGNNSPLAYYAREYIKLKQLNLNEMKKLLAEKIKNLIKSGHNTQAKDGFNKSFLDYAKKDLSLKALYFNIDFDKLDIHSQNMAKQITVNLGMEINQLFIILNELYKGNNFEEYLLELENGQAYLISQYSIQNIIHHKTKQFKRYYAELVIN